MLFDVPLILQLMGQKRSFPTTFCWNNTAEKS